MDTALITLPRMNMRTIVCHSRDRHGFYREYCTIVHIAVSDLSVIAYHNNGGAKFPVSPHLCETVLAFLAAIDVIPWKRSGTRMEAMRGRY